MKIRIVKSSGKIIELSDVAGVEVEKSGPGVISRYDHFGDSRVNFRMECTIEGIGVYDSSIEWPLPPVILG